MLKLWRLRDARRAEGTTGTSTGTIRLPRTWPVTGRVLAGAAVAVTATAAVVAVAGPAGAVSLAESGSSSMIAAEGPGNSLDFYYLSAGTWHAEQVAGPGTTYSAPSLAVVGLNTPVIAAEGPGNSLDFYWQTSSGGWNSQQVAGSSSAYSAPSVADAGPTSGPYMGIAVEGPLNSLSFYYPASSFGAPWTFKRVAGSGSTYAAPSMAKVGTQWPGPFLGIAAEGPNHSLRFYAEILGTTLVWNLQSVTGGGTTYSAPSLALINATPVIAAQGPANSLDFYWQASSGGWNPQQAAGSGTTYSAPSVAHVGTRAAGPYFGIAAEGPADSLSFYYSGNGIGTPWVFKQAAGTGSTYSAPSMTQVGDSGLGPYLGIAAQGPTQSLFFYGQMLAPSTWHPQQVAGTGTTFA